LKPAGARGLAVYALVALTLYALVAPLIGASGLPSYSAGVFEDATIGYYLSAARLLHVWGWWTPAWCLCYQDLTRFYPPLGIGLLYALQSLVPPLHEAALAQAAAVLVLSLGYAYLFAVLSGRRELAVLGASTPLLAHSYAVTAASYWEYTRLLGDGLAALSLAVYMRGLRMGSPSHAVLSGLLAGATLLASLISFAWLAAALAVYSLYELVVVVQSSPEPWPAQFLVGYTATAALAASALTLWFLVPALIPYGLHHYLRIHAPLTLKGEVLADGFLHPASRWTPSPSPILLAGGLAAMALLRRERRLGPYAALAAAAFGLVVIHGQGPRFTPYLEAVMLAAVADAAARGRGRVALLQAAAALAVALLALAEAAPVYYAGMRVDYTFIASDEYIIAYYFSEPPSGPVYMMYSPHLHGAQWVTYFNPRLRQVLSGFMEGCLNPDVYRLDWLIKNTADARAIAALLRKYGVSYLIVDKAWLKAGGPLNPVRRLEEAGVIAKDARLSSMLRYSVAYRVASGPAACGPEPGEPAFLTPSRLLGLALTAAAIPLTVLAARWLTRGAA
jgi:hypothetical protein